MIIETQNNVLVRLYVKREELALSLKRPYIYTYPCGDPRCMVEATWTYIPDRVRLLHNSMPDTVLTRKLYFRPAVNIDETASADLQI